MRYITAEIVILYIVFGFLVCCGLLGARIATNYFVPEPVVVTEYHISAEMRELRVSLDALVAKMLEYEQAERNARGE